MSENGPPHKSLRDSNSIDSTMSFISGASMTRSLERRSSSTASSSSSNGNQVEMSQRDITDVITKQAQAIQQAAARLHQHQYNDQPIMAKKSNAISQSAQNSITGSPTGMVQLNLVNENGIVTPIEINASVAAAAALVAAQKHQQTKIDSEPSTNTMASSMSSTSAVSSFVNGSKETVTGHKPLKLSQPSSNGTSINVSYIQY